MVNGTVTSHGAIYDRAGQAVAINGAIFDRVERAGQGAGTPRLRPLRVQAGASGSVPYTLQLFDKGAIYSSQLSAAPVWLWGELYAVYLASRGPTGPFGLPQSSQVVTNGTATASFQEGSSRAPGH